MQDKMMKQIDDLERKNRALQGEVQQREVLVGPVTQCNRPPLSELWHQLSGTLLGLAIAYDLGTRVDVGNDC